MKNLWLYSLICFAVILFSLLLPYVGKYEMNWINPSLKAPRIYTQGYEDFFNFFPPILIVIISIIVIPFKNLATSIIGLILGAGLLVVELGIAFALTFHLFSDYTYELQIGYMISAASSLIFFILQLLNLVYMIRQRKTQKSKANPDLLDSI